MKKVFLFVAAAFLFACNTNQGYTIKIQVEELAGKDIVLQKSVDRTMVTIDSVTLDSSGAGELTGVIDSPELMFLGEKGTRNNLGVMMDNYNYTFEGTLEDAKIVADGGPQVYYNEYNEVNDGINKRMQKLVELYNTSEEEGASQDSLQKIIDTYQSISKEKQSNDSIFRLNNTSAFSLYLLRRSFYSMDETELQEALSRYDESLHSSSYYTHLSDHLERMKKVAIGNKFIDFTMPDTAGNFVSLSDYVGEGYLLVDFWASWCGPCRRANPGLVKIYDEFKDKGFEMVGVSLDNSKVKWMTAIEDDSLTWYQMSDVKGWESEGAKLYAVASIPHAVLLDKEGTIIAKNLSEEELEEKLTELLVN